MKKRLWIGLSLFLVVMAGGYVERGKIREAWREVHRPELPLAEPFVPRRSTSTVRVSEGGEIVPSSTRSLPASTKPTSTKIVRAREVEVVDPFAGTDPLPERVNLAVPFLSQAPKQNWGMPYQEACEEASMLMVDAFYRGRTTKFAPEEGDRLILDLVSFEEDRGKTPDLTAKEVGQIAGQKWGYDFFVTSTVTPDLVKRALANGYPVIMPADGKRLANPNFRNGGPPYHMLVIKGYVGERTWITNDPGTRLGADFIYPYDHLLTVAHDWNGGDVPHGAPVMIVLVPRVH